MVMNVFFFLVIRLRSIFFFFFLSWGQFTMELLHKLHREQNTLKNLKKKGYKINIGDKHFL